VTSLKVKLASQRVNLIFYDSFLEHEIGGLAFKLIGAEMWKDIRISEVGLLVLRHIKKKVIKLLCKQFNPITKCDIR
jgi:hypothetical protein